MHTNANWKRFFIFLGLAAGLAQPAYAQDDGVYFDLPVEQLFNATVMSATKTESKLWDAPAAIYTVTQDDIRRAGATSIPEALRLVPGVNVARGTTSSWAISVRGFQAGLTNKLLVLMDGREVYDHLFSGVYWDVQDTALEDIDRIEVIRGPGAALWGTNAVNGVINIITKRAADTQGSLLSVTSGNQEHLLTTARHGGTFGDNGHYRAYAKFTDRGENRRLDGTDANDGWTSWRSGFRADWSPKADGNMTVQGDVYRSDSKLYRTVGLLTAPFSATDQEHDAADGGNLLARWDRGLSDGAKVSLQAYIDYTGRTQALLEDDRWSFDVDAQYDFPVSERHQLIAGGRYRFTTDDVTERLFLGPTPYITTQDDPRNEQLFSFFFQDKVTLSPEKWYLTIGSKFDRNEYTGLEVQPNVRLQWHPDSQQMFWTSVSRAMRTPSQLEHDMTIDAGVIPFVFPIKVEVRPNADLGSEEVIAYEAGYRRQLTERATLDAAVFYNKYDKLGTLTSLPGELGANPLHLIFPVRFTNLTNGEAMGGELVWDWQALDTLKLTAVASFVDMQLHGPDSDHAIASEGAEKQAPQRQFNAQARWDVTEQVAFDTTAYFVDDIPAFDVKDYWRVDARLGWRFNPNAEASVTGQNLFQGHHREFSSPTEASAAEIGRSVFGSIVWRF